MCNTVDCLLRRTSTFLLVHHKPTLLSHPSCPWDNLLYSFVPFNYQCTAPPAVTQLFRLQNTGSNPNALIKVSELGRPLGGSFIGLGILFLWLGTSRYFHNQTVLSYGQFPASRGSVVLATVTVLGVLIACFIIVILQGRTS